MKDQLYKLMKQVGDPTAFVEMLNEVQSQIEKENAIMEQKNIELDNARYRVAAAAVEYLDLLFDNEESYSGEREEAIDSFCEILKEAEPEIEKLKSMLNMMKFSSRPIANKHCDNKCECSTKVEKVTETPDNYAKPHKAPIRKDIDADTVINEFLKSLI